jgi:hypothetical protein
MISRTAKKLYQGLQSSTITVRYTAPTNTTAQVTEIYLANTGPDERTFTLYQGGTAAQHVLLNGLVIPAGGSLLLQDLKIVVAAGQTVASRANAGTDITMTLYGIEEV